MAIMAVDPGVMSGICITNVTFLDQRYDNLVKGLGNVRNANRGKGGFGGKMQLQWGEVVISSDLLPGSFAAWFQVGPARSIDQEYWVAVLIADLIELCGVQHLAIEDFILGHGGQGRVGQSAQRDGLSPVRVTSCIHSVLRERRLVKFLGMQGGGNTRNTKKDTYRCGSGVGCNLYTQSPSSAKGVFTDDRLRRAGLWIVGKEHARDAMRHLCLLWRSIEGSVDNRGRLVRGSS